ncbi:MAG: DUF2461 domain-containing protein [Acidobacteria bacterium]|nr:DUF2461 domain-containing protein [Acidobacteriota bacterium]
MSYFTPALFSFLRDLKARNTREWFQANRDRYARDVEAPMLRFIADLVPRLARISPAFVADPRRTGGSMYRIHRDTRFSADKSPYKTHVAASFAHEQRKARPSVPGFYLHLEPGDSLGGGGIYHPDMATLTSIRTAIAENPKGWRAVIASGLEIEGDALTRAPAGFSPSHPLIAYLRLKDFYALVPFTQRDVCADDFLDRYVEACGRVAPLVRFLTMALGGRW